MEEYGEDEDVFDEMFWALWDVVSEMQGECEETGDVWTSFTFELDSEMHFNAEFGYEEKAPDSILGNMRWDYEKLGIIPEADYLKKIFERYLKTGVLMDEDDKDSERLEKLQGIECSVSAEEADYREHILEMLRENEELHEQVAMLCSMEFLEDLEPLESIDDEYSFNMDGEIFAEDGSGGYYAFLEDGSIGYVNFAECECGRIAMILKETLELELNCAYSWHNL